MICGGEGDDGLNGDSQDDTIFGGPGNDTINGRSGADTIEGGPGADTLNGDAQDDTIHGGEGDDVINGGPGDDSLDGGNGTDVVDGSWQNDTCDDAETAPNCETVTYNGEDNSGPPPAPVDPPGVPFACDGVTATIVGTEGDDVLQGTWQDDVIVGLGGNDQIYGQSGADYGQSGADVICGGEGDDIIDGASQNDAIFGGLGNDTITGASGDDVIDGGSGDDTITGDSQNDTIHGGDGNDDINGGPGDDSLDGGNGVDVVDGSWQNDTCDDAEAATNCETTTFNGEDNTPPPVDAVWQPGAITFELAPGEYSESPAALTFAVEPDQALFLEVSESLQDFVVVELDALRSDEATGLVYDTFIGVSVPTDFAFDPTQECAVAGVVRVTTGDERQVINPDLPICVAITPAPAVPQEIPTGFADPALGRILEEGDAGEYISGQLIVGLDYGIANPGQRILEIADSWSGRVVGGVAETWTYQIWFGNQTLSELGDLAVQLAAETGVDFASRSYVSQGDTALPNDEKWDQGAGAWSDWDGTGCTDTGNCDNGTGGNNWYHEAMGMEQAWDLETGSRDVRLGIIDSGFYGGTHDDVAPNVVSVEGRETRDRAHGERMASSACGVGNNNIGISGVIWECSLYLYGNQRNSFASLRDSFSPETQMEQMVAAVDDDVRIVSMSSGFVDNNECVSSFDEADAQKRADETNDILARGVEYARLQGKDVLWVASAGNSCRDVKFGAPSGLSTRFPLDVMVVAAFNQNLEPQRVTNFGPGVSVAGPGEDITQATSRFERVGFLPPTTIQLSEYIEGRDGTSSATALVSGLAALVLAHNPTFSGPQIKECIVAASVSDGVEVVGTGAAASKVPDGPLGFYTVNAPASLKCGSTIVESLPPATSGFPYIASLIDGPPGFAVTIGDFDGLPTGLAISPQGVISGTPEFGGVALIPVTLQDQAGGVTSSTVEFVVNGPELGSLGQALTGVVGQIYSADLFVTLGPDDSPISSVTVTSGSLPLGLSLAAVPTSDSSGVFSPITGTPTTSGLYEFEVTAVNANGAIATRLYILTVVEPLSLLTNGIGVFEEDAQSALSADGSIVAYRTSSGPEDAVIVQRVATGEVLYDAAQGDITSRLALSSDGAVLMDGSTIYEQVGGTYSLVTEYQLSDTAMSANGQFLVGNRTGGLDGFSIINRATGQTEIGFLDIGSSGPVAISNDGDSVLLVAGFNNSPDVLNIYTVSTQTLTSIAVAPDDFSNFLSQTMSDDGRFIAHTSFTDTRRVIVYDRDVDGDGVYDQQNSSTFLLSSGGAQTLPNEFITNMQVGSARISGDGSTVSVLVRQTTSTRAFIQLIDVETDTIAVSTELAAWPDTTFPIGGITTTGSRVILTSIPDLTPGDTNGSSDIYLWDNGA